MFATTTDSTYIGVYYQLIFLHWKYYTVTATLHGVGSIRRKEDENQTELTSVQSYTRYVSLPVTAAPFTALETFVSQRSLSIVKSAKCT